MNGSPIYRLEGITKEYAGRRVLDVPELEVRAGEALAVVGPSGAGKSTLLRLLNFLEAPSQGRIVFEGRPFEAGQPVPLELRRRVTTVFQRPSLLDASVLHNAAYGLALRGDRNARLAARAALEKLGLLPLADAPARTLSGGEAQRVALARALLLNPDALLLDEPTANLDPYNASLIEQRATELNRQGTTIVLVTHNVFQARRLASRTALLLEGRLVEIAPTEQFFEDPQDARTAAFVRGEMIY